MTTEEKLKHFLEASIESATNQSTQIIDDYSKALQILFEDHKIDAQRKAELQIRLGRESLEREMNKELFREQLRIKREMTKKQIKEAAHFAGTDDIMIYIDPSDADRLKELEDATKAHLTVSDTEFMGGTRAVIQSRNILIDNSFETKLKEAKEAFSFLIN